MILLASLGLTFILKQGEIFDIPRNWLKKQSKILNTFFNCAMCLGFWSGLFVGIISFMNPVEILLLGFASSFCGFIVQHIITIVELLFFEK